METGSQLSIDPEVLPEPLANESGDPTFSSSTSTDVMPQQPVKKATRQWAAWTHEEEENFFNALRQVGKNFDKITWRVQSKNKDQVRHYYYRLVRRMNKLLGPGLCLDAKNSKDTIAAMLRWWSLLEKYSCKASKLHLKPRRFKIFIEALELQLLKDRKKNINRRLLLGGNCLPTTPGTISNQRRLSENDVRSVKLVFVDSSNILGPRKASLKRNPNMGVNCSNKKGESDTVKSLRQRRKAGPTSAAAYKKWEEAAIAGVSLVADAAAHLEETATIKEIKNGQNIPGQKYSSDDQNDLPSLHTLPKTHYMVDSNGSNPAKLKLQLFPIDDGTRRALEMDKHNPYLELTLSPKKRISSVLDHLNKKWGDSNIAVGELMLFPYSTLDENSVGHHRWAHDSLLSAADVYTILGSPQVFRLRYGWFSFGVSSTSMQANMESGYTLVESNNSNTNVNRANKDDQVTHSASFSISSTNDMPVDFPDYRTTYIAIDNAQAAAPADLPSTIDDNEYSIPESDINKFSDLGPTFSWNRDDSSYVRIAWQKEDMDDLRGIGLSACEWADSLMNNSVGDVLSGVARDIVDDCMDAPVSESPCCMHQVPFCSDSFDAAIAAYISHQQDKTAPKPTLASNTSIWDGEETCDAFSFKKDSVLWEDRTGFSALTPLDSSKQFPRSSPELVEHLPGVVVEAKNEFLSDRSVLDTAAKDFNGLANMYWPDSLGPLDLDIQSSKYHSEHLILSDSLSGLNQLIASSLDAFQNCSFFGFDKKEASSTVETRQIGAFSDVKVSSEA